MKAASGPLTTLLNTSTTFLMADLFDITTASGVSRYASSDLDILVTPNNYIATGPLIKRTGTRTIIGLETDTMKISVMASQTHLLEGIPFVQAVMRGALANSTVSVQKAFMSAWGVAPVGVLPMFAGRVSNIRVSRNNAEIEVKSDIEILSTRLPRNLYQPPCVNTLYDSACAVSRAAFLVSYTASGGTVSTMTTTGLSGTYPSGWFDQGTVLFTSGPNTGLKRTVKSYLSGNFTFALPLPFAIGSGDGFQALPGCNKSQATCTSKFSNLPRFKGVPYIPAAEVAL